MSVRGLPMYLRVDAVPVVITQLSLFGFLGRNFAPYQQWEDYRAGMFGGRMSDAFIALAAGCLGSNERCLEAMRRVIREWPVASSVNLTNSGLNRRAWLGQAACCLSVGATANETKRAWWQLREAERMQANGHADSTIQHWRSAHGL